MSVFDSIGSFFNNATNSIGNVFSPIFDPNNHGVFDGNWSDFQLGINRVAGIPSSIIANNLNTIGGAITNNTGGFLNQLSMNPSFYFIAVIGIIISLIVGYGAFKALKYV